MPSKTTAAKATGKTAVAVARRPALRRATVKAAKPPAKVGWHIGKLVVKRKARGQVKKARGHAGRARGQVDRAREQVGKARDQVERLGTAGKTVGSIILIYGPMAAEVFGLVETPKPKRRAPAFAAGLATGAGALYVLKRKNSN